MNKNNTMSFCVGCLDVAERWNMEIIPNFKKRKDTNAIKSFESGEVIVFPSGHHGNVICSKEKPSC
jgi:hypothetical protein